VLCRINIGFLRGSAKDALFNFLLNNLKEKGNKKYEQAKEYPFACQ
jgi:hypothetical protein